MNHNPYAAPQSQVAEQQPGIGELATDPHARGAGAAVRWLSRGWELFMLAPIPWVLMFLLFLIMSLVMQFIPLIGPLANSLLQPVFLAGMYLGCERLSRNEPISVGQLFEGFSNNVGQLVLIGVINLLIGVVFAIVLIVPIIAIFGVAIFTGASGSGNPDIGAGAAIALILVGVLALGLGVLVGLAMWFAPMLVAINGLNAVDAIKLSFAGGMRNIGGAFIYFLLAVVIMLIGLIPLGLGLLVTSPLLFAGSYAAYREIFFGD